MNKTDLKKSADLIRKTCDTIDTMHPNNAVKAKLLALRRYAETLSPEAGPSFAKIQWEELKRRIGWIGTEEQYEAAMIVSFGVLKACYHRGRKPEKPEIAI